MIAGFLFEINGYIPMIICVATLIISARIACNFKVIDNEENKIEENNKSVSRNKYNEFNKIVLEKEKIAKKYFDDYIYNAVSNSEEAYKLLNEEYRTKRFPNINEYKEYIKQNIEQLETLDAKGIKSFEEFNDEDKYKEYIGKLQLKGIEQYNITNKDKYKQIECVDVYGNYYLFNVKAAMDYTVILDAYTIDLPDVLEKYNSSSNENKVAMNKAALTSLFELMFQ